ncbi:MAG: amidase family protein [Alphaproteobacteria bacterium]|nr:amidase family protein [Alphaproteobacteria bacterium]
MPDELWTLSACAAVDHLKNGTLRPAELLGALAERIAAVNPIINALPTLCFDRAHAVCGDVETSGGGFQSPLHGLPLPIKDSYEVEGVRTTWGSLAFKDHVAVRSDYAVQSIEGAGGVVYAKSNTPEFEAGANTFNAVFGRTVNPWNTKRSAAGSSGGAAAAVATGAAFLAQGSDFACSLRYPASFCGIVGLRPTPGLIPQGPSPVPYQTLSVIGPLARSVADVGLGLDAMTGFDARDPLTRPVEAAAYRVAAEQPKQPTRFAYSADLGVAVVSRQVREIVGSAVDRLAQDGPRVEEVTPDLADCHDAFRPLRAFQFSATRHPVLATARDRLKPEVVWNIEQGLQLTAEDLADAENKRSSLRHEMHRFLDRHDFLITPTAPVAPNPVEERYVSAIEGIELETYLDWLVLGYAITVTGCPAISVPCGFTDDGLPVGLQIVAAPHCEHNLLRMAAWCEAVLGVGLSRPIDPIAHTD